MHSEARFLPAGEAALVVEFGSSIDPALNDKVRALERALAAKPIEGIVETVPTYRSLMIHFDPRLLSSALLIERLGRLEPAAGVDESAPRHWVIPICYEEPYAEDLAEVAAALGLSAERVADLHAGATYRIYMYGFAPGYVFLGGLPEELTSSRRPTSRPPVRPGAVLIAGGQALIASLPMPTGWYCIGRTPAMLFDPKRNPPVLVEIGDLITFEPIGGASFAALHDAAAEGEPVARAV
jgi:inhibitor of KinA